MAEKGISRRQFMERSVIGAAGAAAANARLGAEPVSIPASEKITLGIIGAGIRGQEDMQSVLRVGGNVAMVADLYDGHLRRAREILPNVPGTRDYREVLDRKDVDAVLIATSDHWHAPIALEAMKAGKD